MSFYLLQGMLLVLTLFISACVSDRPKAKYRRDLVVDPNKKNIKIETAADGTGIAPTFTGLTAGDSKIAYAVIRDIDGNFVGVTNVDWALTSSVGTITSASPNNSVVFTATGDGRTSLGDDSGTLMASHTDYNADGVTVTVTVTKGASTNVYIETAADGSGTEVGTNSLNAGDTSTVYAVSRDLYDNFVQAESVTWSFDTLLGSLSTTLGSSTIFTATQTGTATLTADHATLIDDTTGMYTIGPSSADHIKIETAIDGSGTEISDATLTSGDTLTLYMVIRDTYGNYIATDDNVTWTVPGGIGTFSPSGDGGITGNKGSEVFTAFSPGSYPITADHAIYTDDLTATITVQNNRPVLSGTETFYTPVNTSLPFTLTAGSDADAGHTITYSMVSNVSSGSLTQCMDLTSSDSGQDLSCYYAPETGQSGSFTFSYRGSDSYENSVSDATVTIYVVNNLYRWSNHPAGPANTDSVSHPSSSTGLGLNSTANLAGTREGSAYWKDQSGLFWLFGGKGVGQDGSNGYLNDMWKFDSSTSEWTYVRGASTTGASSILSASVSLGGSDSDVDVSPGARMNPVTWSVAVDGTNSELYLFGGNGARGATVEMVILDDTFEAGDIFTLNGVAFTAGTEFAVAATGSTAARALQIASAVNQSSNSSVQGVISAYADGINPSIFFMYDTQGSTPNGVTTIVETADNVTDNFSFPKALAATATFSDGTDTATTTGLYNDLWKFSTQTATWTLVKADIINASYATSQDSWGRFGTVLTASDSYYPSPREMAAGNNWTDLTNPSFPKLYLFGGQGNDSRGVYGYLNDLWYFDTQTNMWVWVAGSNQVSSGGTYGTKGVPSTANIPGSRLGASSFKTSDGYFWLFGGYGYPASGGVGYLDDLWRYDFATSQWMFVSGNSTRDEYSNFTAQGSPASADYPGGRKNACAIADATDRLWIQGGFGYASGTGPSYLNGLWVFDGSNWAFMYGDDAIDSLGDYTSGMLVEDAVVKPGSRFGHSCWTDSNNDFWFFGGNGHDNATSGWLYDIWRYNP